jgi:beta-galactosidase/beta-glucuronidase
MARSNRQMDSVKIKFGVDSKKNKNLSCEMHIIPENFHGESYNTSLVINTREKDFEFNIPAKNPKLWDADHPYLYLCRIILKDNGKVVDARDVLFGFRTFEMVSEKYPQGQLKPGTFLLNGKQTFLRGTNMQGLNPLIFWGEKEKALDVLLMVKAANFNFIRSCQHVQFKEVRELQDRLGIMSCQEKGSRYPEFGKRTEPYLISAIEKLTKEVYNNPGVVMLSFANEMENFTDCSREIEAVLKIDKDRIINPVSGIKHSGEYAVAPGTHYNISEDLYSKVIEDVHEYPGWYKFLEQPWKFCHVAFANGNGFGRRDDFLFGLPGGCQQATK